MNSVLALALFAAGVVVVLLFVFWPDWGGGDEEVEERKPFNLDDFKVYDRENPERGDQP